MSCRYLHLQSDGRPSQKPGDAIGRATAIALPSYRRDRPTSRSRRQVSRRRRHSFVESAPKHSGRVADFFAAHNKLFAGHFAQRLISLPVEHSPSQSRKADAPRAGGLTRVKPEG